MVVSLISRLSVLTVTRNRNRASRSNGCFSILGTAPVCTLELGHISSGIRLSRTMPASRPRHAVPSGSSSISSTIRTPCPNRSAPQNAMASWMDGRPNASPAWMVNRALLARMYSKASRWRDGG